MSRIETLQHYCYQRMIAELREYHAGRKSDVQKGLETARFSALLLEKFALGLIKASQILFEETPFDTRELSTLADDLCLDIDPNFKENRQKRWVVVADLDLETSREAGA